MVKRIRVVHSGRVQPVIRNTGPKQPVVDPAQVAAALGAEPTGTRVTAAGPMALLGLRQELARRLQSSGGRPALDDTTRRPKIPISDEDWRALEQFAASAASDEVTPTAGQIASILLRRAIKSLQEEISSGRPTPFPEVSSTTTMKPA